jgi:hypothetical protein
MDEEREPWESDPDAWRGSAEENVWPRLASSWPEDLAGPEYWMYKLEDEPKNGE